MSPWVTRGKNLKKCHECREVILGGRRVQTGCGDLDMVAEGLRGVSDDVWNGMHYDILGR